MEDGLAAGEGEEVPTFKMFVEEKWLPVYPDAAGNRKNTMREKEFHLRVYLIPELGDQRLDRITGEVGRWHSVRWCRRSPGGSAECR
jgi:hypothetical protein